MKSRKKPDDPEFGGKQKKRKVLRNEPKVEELKWTKHTLVEGGEFEIDFGEKRTIYKIDFRFGFFYNEQKSGINLTRIFCIFNHL